MTKHSYRCQLCDAVFVCRPNETDQLLRHANEAHPDVIGQFTIEGEILEKHDKDSKRPMCARWTLVLPTAANPAPGSSRRHHRHKRHSNGGSSKTPTSSRTTDPGYESYTATTYGDSYSYTGSSPDDTPAFWTTVETWRPGPSRIPCPNCGVVARPIVRRQKRRVSRTLPGALCVLTCWPICFLPFMSGHGQLGEMRLYCSSCDHFIAIFDPATETFMRPPEEEGRKRKESQETGGTDGTVATGSSRCSGKPGPTGDAGVTVAYADVATGDYSVDDEGGNGDAEESGGNGEEGSAKN